MDTSFTAKPESSLATIPAGADLHSGQGMGLEPEWLLSQSDSDETDRGAINAKSSDKNTVDTDRSAKDPQQRTVNFLQHWEGVVYEVDCDSFWAETSDLTDESMPNEQVELPLDDVPIGDRHLLVPGCVFYWSVGYEKLPSGTIRRISEIRLKRTPKWTAKQVKSVEIKAKELYERFTGCGEEETAGAK